MQHSAQIDAHEDVIASEGGPQPIRVTYVLQTRLTELLLELGHNIPSGLKGLLPQDARALVLYGSQARGDAVPGSDVDLLALVDTPTPSSARGDVNVSFYTRDQLATGMGTLFGAHLRRDARIVWDPDGELERLIASLGDVDPARLLTRARAMTTLFTSLDRDLPKYLPGLLREARYLLRSCLYVQAIAQGRPCFSVRELAQRHDDNELVILLASRHDSEPAETELRECLRRLRDLLGPFPGSSQMRV